MAVILVAAATTRTNQRNAPAPPDGAHCTKITEIGQKEQRPARSVPESQVPYGRPFPMKFEPWPGGRWYRALGDNTGHLWLHVQVIKPPKQHEWAFAIIARRKKLAPFEEIEQHLFEPLMRWNPSLARR